MRIDGNYTYNQLAIQNNQSRLNAATENKVTNETGNSAKAFDIQDTYEPASAQLKVNFGGYDKNGRAAVSNINRKPMASVDFSTESGTKASGRYGSIVSDLSKVLGTDEEGTVRKVKDAGLAVEDLVDRNAVKGLAEDAKTQGKLQDFATEERSSLLEESGMSESELDEFVAAVRG